MSIFYYLFYFFGVTFFTVMRTDGQMSPPSTCALRQTTHPLPFGMCDHEVPFMEARTWRQLSAAPCLLLSLSTSCPQICTSMFAMSRSRGQNLYKAEAVQVSRTAWRKGVAMLWPSVQGHLHAVLHCCGQEISPAVLRTGKVDFP